MSWYCECAGIAIISKYVISEGLFLITVALGWHAKASSHFWSILAGAQAKRFSAPFSREHTFLPNVALILCQGRWANCHFWLSATKRQRLSTPLSPVSQNGPHTLKVPDYWFFSPQRLYNMEYFLSASVCPLGWFRHLQECVNPWRPLEGHLSVLTHLSEVWAHLYCQSCLLYLAFLVFYFLHPFGKNIVIIYLLPWSSNKFKRGCSCV